MDKGEIFVYSLLGKDQFECLVSDGKHFKPGFEIVINEKVSFLSLAFTENGIAFQIKGMDLLDFLEKYGEMPLPPYIKYGKEILKLLDALWAPRKVAVIHCWGHQEGTMVTRGNFTADRKATRSHQGDNGTSGSDHHTVP